MCSPYVSGSAVMVLENLAFIYAPGSLDGGDEVGEIVPAFVFRLLHRLCEQLFAGLFQYLENLESLHPAPPYATASRMPDIEETAINFNICKYIYRGLFD